MVTCVGSIIATLLCNVLYFNCEHVCCILESSSHVLGDYLMFSFLISCILFVFIHIYCHGCVNELCVTLVITMPSKLNCTWLLKQKN